MRRGRPWYPGDAHGLFSCTTTTGKRGATKSRGHRSVPTAYQSLRVNLPHMGALLPWWLMRKGLGMVGTLMQAHAFLSGVPLGEGDGLAR